MDEITESSTLAETFEVVVKRSMLAVADIVAISESFEERTAVEWLKACGPDRLVEYEVLRRERLRILGELDRLWQRLVGIFVDAEAAALRKRLGITDECPEE